MKIFWTVFFAAILAGKTSFAQTEDGKDRVVELTITKDQVVKLTVKNSEKTEENFSGKEEKKEKNPENFESKIFTPEKIEPKITKFTFDTDLLFGAVLGKDIRGFVGGIGTTFSIVQSKNSKWGFITDFEYMKFKNASHNFWVSPYFIYTFQSKKHEISAILGLFALCPEVGAKYRYKFENGFNIFGRAGVGLVLEGSSSIFLRFSGGIGYKVDF